MAQRISQNRNKKAKLDNNKNTTFRLEMKLKWHIKKCIFLKSSFPIWNFKDKHYISRQINKMEKYKRVNLKKWKKRNNKYEIEENLILKWL